MPRSDHTATLLKSGKVLVAGGRYRSFHTYYLNTVEVYDPATGAFTAASSMSTDRYLHTATLLSTGKVLVTGGRTTNPSFQSLASAILFDPVAGTWTATGSMKFARANFTATLLSSSKVLVVGTTAEVYTPGTGAWTSAGKMNYPRANHSATLLGSGEVLVAGGTAAEIYDPGANLWKLTGGLKYARSHHTASRLGTGMVLVAGGGNGVAELYDPTNGNACILDTECISGHCVDGHCCDAACTKTCKSCVLKTTTQGTFATCELVPAGQQDASAKSPCTGAQACDGKGNCKLANGQACTLGSLCGSGHCADGVCCTAPCSGTCQSCKLPGKLGACGLVPAGDPDSSASFPCVGSKLCDGAGICKSKGTLAANGQSCTQASQCFSGSCVDGYCCSSTCTTTCKGCGVKGKQGACAPLPNGSLDSNATIPCVGAQVCDGAGACKPAAGKKANGQACAKAADCYSAHCVDAVCCSSACASVCMSCGLTGKAGTCEKLPAGQPDLSSSPPCAGSQVCDGQGKCISVGSKKINGQACSGNGDCFSGHCTDGVCCDATCYDTCKACDVAGALGACAPVPQGKPDSSATTPCKGTKSCDGSGKCLLATAQPCTKAGECATGHCVDWICCAASCTETCRSCALPGKLGACSMISQGKPDHFAASTCKVTQACDGFGYCKSGLGQACTKGNTCAGGLCVDGYCCDSACTGQCRACNIAGAAGSCTKVPFGQPCGSGKVCDGSGGCIVANGYACTKGSECASGFCVDGYCCNEACGASCKACNVAGTLGTCTSAPYGKSCAAFKVCDGKGTCLLATGESCGLASACASGHCVDTVCCDSACSATCRACSLPGSKGSCSLVPAGKQDSFATSPCTGNDVCDGQGSCKKKLVQPCTSPGQCASGHCVDGYCCYSACAATCRACSVPGMQGFCSFISSGQQDTYPASTCVGNKACSGKGVCGTVKGKPCASGSECLTGYCSDGVCCDKACGETCKSCNLSGTAGTCSDVPKGQPDTKAATPCDAGGTATCDGKGSCKKSNGRTCNNPSECGSGYCVDGRCCDGECKESCVSCKIAGKEGTCTPHPKGGDPDKDCQGKDDECGGKCDGAGKCDYPSTGTLCGKSACKACDGTGQCTKTPLDDTRCGLIDCDKLDTSCMDYHDLTDLRCAALGVCKKANDLKACSKHTKLACGDAKVPDLGAMLDRGAGADQGGGGGPKEDTGCSCEVRGAGAPDGGLAMLLVALLAALRRRRGRSMVTSQQMSCPRLASLCALLVGLLALLTGGCAEPPESARQEAPPHAIQSKPLESPARHTDPRSGISFRLPPGLEVSAEHAAEGGPAGEIRHLLTLTRQRTEVLSIQLWDNPTGLPLATWFDEHLAFVRDRHAIVSWASLSTHRVQGMVIRRPRSGQAHGQRMAVFAAAGQVVRVTCQDEDHPATLAAYDQVVQSLALAAQP